MIRIYDKNNEDDDAVLLFVLIPTDPGFFSQWYGAEFCDPCPTEIIAITEAMPIIIPSMVKEVRTLLTVRAL